MKLWRRTRGGMSGYLPRLADVVVFVVLMLAVAFARLSMWRTRPRSHTFTVALFVLGVAFVLSLPYIGDRYVDPALSFAGANISDLAHTILVVVACWLFGVINLRALSWSGWQHVWTVCAAFAVAALVVLWRVGDVSRVPVDREMQLQDWPTNTYLGIFYGFAAATCVLVFLGSAAAWRSSRRALRGALLALCGVGVLGVTYVGIGVFWLVHRTVWMQADGTFLLLAGPGLLVVGISLAGVAPVVDTWRRRVRVRQQAWSGAESRDSLRTSEDHHGSPTTPTDNH
jgi:hypothetical protein